MLPMVVKSSWCLGIAATTIIIIITIIITITAFIAIIDGADHMGCVTNGTFGSRFFGVMRTNCWRMVRSAAPAVSVHREQSRAARVPALGQGVLERIYG